MESTSKEIDIHVESLDTFTTLLEWICMNKSPFPQEIASLPMANASRVQQEAAWRQAEELAPSFVILYSMTEMFCMDPLMNEIMDVVQAVHDRCGIMVPPWLFDLMVELPEHCAMRRWALERLAIGLQEHGWKVIKSYMGEVWTTKIQDSSNDLMAQAWEIGVEYQRQKQAGSISKPCKWHVHSTPEAAICCRKGDKGNILAQGRSVKRKETYGVIRQACLTVSRWFFRE